MHFTAIYRLKFERLPFGLHHGANPRSHWNKKMQNLHAYSGNIIYMYIESLIINFVILYKAKIMSLHWEIIKMIPKWKYNQK